MVVGVIDQVAVKTIGYRRGFSCPETQQGGYQTVPSAVDRVDCRGQVKSVGTLRKDGYKVAANDCLALNQFTEDRDEIHTLIIVMHMRLRVEEGVGSGNCIKVAKQGAGNHCHLVLIKKKIYSGLQFTHTTPDFAPREE
uniref:Uncharacterized protein n=1 Tax=Timema tahoe TaxID=61484 RepID=A0A7R9FJL1_9NEOP|nr:unnamed protein product [Timema tahoe]